MLEIKGVKSLYTNEGKKRVRRKGNMSEVNGVKSLQTNVRGNVRNLLSGVKGENCCQRYR